MAVINPGYVAPLQVDANWWNKIQADQLTGPNGTALGAMGRINAPAEATLNTQLTNIGGVYNPQREAAGTNLQANLAGFGGFSFVKNGDGSLTIDYNENGPLGDRQRNAVQGAQQQANARGILSSSFADKQVGAALGQLDAEKQRAINQYFSDITGINAQQANSFSSLSGQLAGLLGNDAMYAVQNYVAPPPPPPPPPPPTPSDPAYYGDPGNMPTRSAGLGRFIS